MFTAPLGEKKKKIKGGEERDTYKRQEAENKLQKPPPAYCFWQFCLAWVRAAIHGHPV